MGILKSTTDLTTITLTKYFSEKPKKNIQQLNIRRFETEEKMKLAIVCVFALILLAINVEGANLCYDGCTAESGKGPEKCRTVRCRGIALCVIRFRPDSGMADGCFYGKISPGFQDCKKFKKPIQIRNNYQF